MPHPRSGSTMCITRRAGHASDSTPNSKETSLGVEHLEPWPRYSGGAFRLGKTKALSKSFRWYVLLPSYLGGPNVKQIFCQTSQTTELNQIGRLAYENQKKQQRLPSENDLLQKIAWAGLSGCQN